MNETIEINYRDIDNFPGYRVGSDGSVWSCWRLIGGRGTRQRVLTDEWKRLKANQPAYPRVSLIDRDGKRHDMDVHILVLTAFVGPRPSDEIQGRHLNDVPNDNRLDNLKWGTPSENWEDSRRNGRRTIGEQVHNAKATVDLVIRIRSALAGGETLKSVASWSGLSWQQVHAIGARRVWKHVP